MKGRLTAVFIGFSIFAAILITRAVQLQILPHSRLTELSKRQFQSQMTLKPKRGPIVDRNGEVLAFSVETKSLAANPNKIKNKRQFSSRWGHTLGISSNDLYKRLQTSKSFVWIHRHISEDLTKRLADLRQSDALEGIMIVPESRRVYPFGSVASNLLGTVSIDSEGLEGVELWQNERLKGREVQVQIQRDALGRTAWVDTVRTRQLKQGEEVQLTLDLALQFAVENELKSSLRSTGAQAGTVIVMDAVSGEILALANAPTFDPNERLNTKDFSFEVRRNRAMTDGFEPGSTVKPLVLAAALKKGKTLKTKVHGGMGEFRLQGHTIQEAESHEQFGWITLKKMIQVSSNIATAKLALELGPETVRNQLIQFGLSQKTGIGFPGELGGWIPSVKEMRPLTLANVSFGQGLYVTPLQLLRSYATFANGGWLISPKLLSKTQSEAAPVRVISEQVAQEVNEAMFTVVEAEGTGVKAAVSGYRIAGKTGTAQVFDRKLRRYSPSQHVASFIGFAAGIKPEIVVYASLSNPKGVYYASETAAPLFARVFQEVAARYLLTAQPALAQKPNLAPSSTSEQNIKPVATLPLARLEKSAGSWPMPALKGLSAREVLKTLEGHDFAVDIEGFGVVKQQLPRPGTVIAEGERIKVELSHE